MAVNGIEALGVATAGWTGTALRLAALLGGLEVWLLLRGIRTAFGARASPAGGGAATGGAATGGVPVGVPLGTEDLGPAASRDQQHA